MAMEDALPTQFDVAVVGNAGIDTNIYLAGRDIDFGVEANFTENLDYVGQAGGYASRGYARLGKRVAFIGYVGDDFCGRFIREELTSDGIDTTALFVDDEGTSRSVNIVFHDGRRKNFYDGKGHMHLQPRPDVCRQVLAGARLAHFHIPNWARLLLPVARSLGLTIACDIQDVAEIDDPYRQDFVRYADVLFFSAVNQGNPTPLIVKLLHANPYQIVVAGMGPHGCALGTETGIEFFPAVELEAPVVDTNGAGDALAVGFLSSYLLDGYSIHEAVLRGQIAARYTCTLKATSSRLITQAQLDRYFQTKSGIAGSAPTW